MDKILASYFCLRQVHKWFSLGGLPNSLLDANTVVKNNPQLSHLLGKKDKRPVQGRASHYPAHFELLERSPVASTLLIGHRATTYKGLGGHRNTVVEEEAVPYPGPHWPVPSPAGHRSSSPLDHSYYQCPGS